MESGYFLCKRVWAGRVYYMGLLLALGVVHAVLYIADPGLQFFFGDSGSYLQAADEFVPADRSFVYGLVIKELTKASLDLNALVATQVMAFAAASWLFAILLREYFGVRPAATFLVTMVVSVLPIHLLWTRYLMTEALAIAALTLMFLLAFEYLRSGRWLWLVPLQLVGICAISMRTVLIPMVFAFTVGLPLLAAWARHQRESEPEPNRRRGTRLALHIAIGVACMVPLHNGYKAEYATRLSNSRSLTERLEAKYSHETGLFYLEFFCPLIGPQDFPAGLDGAALLAQASRNDEPRGRNAQHWNETGLVAVLRRALAANPQLDLSLDDLCTHIALGAARRDPLGILWLAWESFSDFWDTNYFAGFVVNETGLNRRIPDDVDQVLREMYGMDIADRPLQRTLLKRGYQAMQPYMTVLSLAFLVPLVFWRSRARTRPYLTLLVGTVLFFWAATLFLSTLPGGRFQQPISWLLWLLLVGRYFGQHDAGIQAAGSHGATLPAPLIDQTPVMPEPAK